MLKYAVIPLILLTLTSCAGNKKSMKQGSSAVDANNISVAEFGMNEYYGCRTSGPIAVINFDYDKSLLSDKAKDVLHEAYTKCIADYLATNHDVKLLVTGHTDRHGTVEYNVALGARRSDATKMALSDLAIKHSNSASDDSADDSNKQPIKQKICTTSKGKEEQLYPPHIPDADFKNRRSVLEFVDANQCE